MSVEYHHVAEGQDFRVRSGIRNLGQGFRSGRGDQRGEQKKGPNNFWLHLPDLFRPNNEDEEEEMNKKTFKHLDPQAFEFLTETFSSLSDVV